MTGQPGGFARDGAPGPDGRAAGRPPEGLGPYRVLDGSAPGPAAQQDQPPWQDKPPWPGALRRPGGPSGAVPPGHQVWAAAGYAGAAIPVAGFFPPLLVYLLWARRSRFLRAHAAQAANLALTTSLYLVCLVIVAGMLALDSVTLGLAAGAAGLLMLWSALVVQLARGARAAGDGAFRPAAGWLCATFLRP